MPIRRRIELAAPLVSRMAGANSVENAICGPALARAVGSGRATARFLGINSPNTIDSEVANRIARTSEVPGTARAGNPIASSAGTSSRESTGSARKPVASVVIEIPSCAPESWNDRVRCARATILSRLPPDRALASTVLRSRAVSENSAATNTAVPIVSSTKNTRLSAMVIALTGATRDDRRTLGPAV